MSSDVLEWRGGSLDFSQKPLIMGILNVTPDSFSDGGDFLDINKALARAKSMVREGAAVIDVGPESSRPGAEPVPVNEQIDRAVPVIRRLSCECPAVISIDTPEPEVAAAAIEAGAAMINDITGLDKEEMISLAARSGCPVVIMHMLGNPRTMQADPHYEDVVEEVLCFLLARARKIEKAGVPREYIFLDPGIGFGKTREHNLSLLKHIGRFVETGCRTLVGASRKRFIGDLTGKADPRERVFGTVATTAWCAAAGVDMLRVHDIGPNRDVLKIINAVRSAD